MFYKVTCPTCRVAAPVAERLWKLADQDMVAVGQDPSERLKAFAREFALSFDSIADDPPYDLSNAYGIRTVPTVFLLRDGRVEDVVESWDRDGWNRAGAKLLAMAGRPPEALSWEGDGLPPFRPG